MIFFFCGVVSRLPLLMMSSQRCDSLITFAVENRRVARRALALARALGLTLTTGFTGWATRSVSVSSNSNRDGAGRDGAGRADDLAVPFTAARPLVPPFPARVAA